MKLLAGLPAGLMALLLAATLTTMGPVPAEARTPQGTYQHQIQKVTDNKRVAHDRTKLRKQACVQKYAVRQARRMARQERMYHQDLGPILRDCGLRAVGENVAYGYPNGRAVVRAWMHSEGHRENILNRTFRLLGAGARQSDDGTWYAVQVFGRK